MCDDLSAVNAQEEPGVPRVAILGLSGRFPGAGDPAQFWTNLRAGRDSIMIVAGAPRPSAATTPSEGRDDVTVRGCGRIDDATSFDAAFFGLSPAAASAIEPQGRLFLEAAWEAFEQAGYVGERVEGPVAVFAAPGPHRHVVRPAPRPSSAPVAGWVLRDRIHAHDVLATLISSELNLTGPSIDVRTGGASSLAAVHLACQSLLNGECDMALAGGATVHTDEELGDWGEPMSPDARCRPFDAAAAGTVPGSAVACVLLKRLDDAIRDGDRVLAVIRGSAINNTGARHADDQAATVAAQVRAVTEALAIAGVSASQVSYVEAHGAGTRSADASEMIALTKAFRAQTADRQFCAVGSVKGNIGHAGDAAGIAGLAKVVLALQHREVPPSLHVERQNPDASFDDGPFYVNTALRAWPAPVGQRRTAGVTSLGEGGSNVHLIVEDAPDAPASGPARTFQLLALSAATPAALETMTRNLAAYLRATPGVPLADVASTLLDGRKAMPYRRAVIARDGAEAVRALESSVARGVFSEAPSGRRPNAVWLFSGGSLAPGVGAGLHASEPVYRQAIDEALSRLDIALGTEVRALVSTAAPSISPRTVVRPAYALPALVAVEYAVGCLLQSWGLTAAALMGEGPGEYVAACFAGVFGIQQAMALAASEGRIREDLEVGLNPDASALRPAPSIESAIEEFERFCRTMTFHAPTGRLVSSVTGESMTEVDPAYWSSRLRGGGRANEGLRTLQALTDVVFLEIGPDRSLIELLRGQPGAPATAIHALRRPDEPEADLAVLLAAVGALWSAGVPVDASKLHAGERRRRVGLPTYPFERRPLPAHPEFPAASANGALGASSPVPLDHIERELATMWSEVLGLDDVATRDDFFELGGHSLAAVRLFGRIRDTFGVDLPLGMLVESPTIASLAPRLQHWIAEGSGAVAEARPIRGAAVPSSSLVAVQPGTGRAPLFVVHGAGGNILNIRDLARALGPAQAVFGLQAAGIDGVGQPGATIEEMAQAYLEDVKAVQPQGPYMLAGYSGGGVIAFEMARRLSHSGEAIGVLAFIDTFHPQMPTPTINAWTRLERLRDEGLSYVRDGLIRTWQSFADARATRRLDEHLAARQPVPLPLRERHLIRSFKQAAHRYVPRPWPGKAVLFRAEQVDYYDRAGGLTYGWDSVILGGIEIVPVPGDHSSILAGSNAARIAHRLAQTLDAVNAATDQESDG